MAIVPFGCDGDLFGDFLFFFRDLVATGTGLTTSGFDRLKSSSECSGVLSKVDVGLAIELDTSLVEFAAEVLLLGSPA